MNSAFDILLNIKRSKSACLSVVAVASCEIRYFRQQGWLDVLQYLNTDADCDGRSSHWECYLAVLW